MQTIADSLGAADRLVGLAIPDMGSVSDTDKVRELEEYIVAIQCDLSEHMRFEEQEVLPTIIRYAAEIISRGLLFEHEGILNSITDLREKVMDLVSSHPDHAALVIDEARIIGKLHDIHAIVKEHIQKQEAILELAYLACESLETETGQNSQT
jgi:iron-sulfur cluster repair protein YtfE (RIC family)